MVIHVALRLLMPVIVIMCIVIIYLPGIIVVPGHGWTKYFPPH
jgi:hypothetical protein